MSGPGKPGAVGIVHLYPTLMGTYGDGGNVRVLVRRLRQRGLDAEVVTVHPGEPVPATAELYVLGGGEDASQIAAADELRRSGALERAGDSGAAVFAVCAGLQILGHSFEAQGRNVPEPGLGLLDAVTVRRSPRAVGEVLAEPFDGLPLLTGYENHGGGTDLGPDARPLAKVLAGVGNGGGRGGGLEGVVQGKVLATYLHGPVLARNPVLADYLLELATGLSLEPLDAPYVAELRAEREAYARSGRLSAESARTSR